MPSFSSTLNCRTASPRDSEIVSIRSDGISFVLHADDRTAVPFSLSSFSFLFIRYIITSSISSFSTSPSSPSTSSTCYPSLLPCRSASFSTEEEACHLQQSIGNLTLIPCTVFKQQEKRKKPWHSRWSHHQAAS